MPDILCPEEKDTMVIGVLTEYASNGMHGTAVVCSSLEERSAVYEFLKRESRKQYAPYSEEAEVRGPLLHVWQYRPPEGTDFYPVVFIQEEKHVPTLDAVALLAAMREEALSGKPFFSEIMWDRVISTLGRQWNSADLQPEDNSRLRWATTLTSEKKHPEIPVTEITRLGFDSKEAAKTALLMLWGANDFAVKDGVQQVKEEGNVSYVVEVSAPLSRAVFRLDEKLHDTGREEGVPILSHALARSYWQAESRKGKENGGLGASLS